MPITQERMIAIIHIIDHALSAQERVRNMIDIELDAAMNDFYSNGGEGNSLANDLLARIQSIKDLASEPLISVTAVETLAREREHFRSQRGHNIRSARAMRRRRSSPIDPGSFRGPDEHNKE